jgi:hypothetical protein
MCQFKKMSVLSNNGSIDEQQLESSGIFMAVPSHNLSAGYYFSPHPFIKHL